MTHGHISYRFRAYPSASQQALLLEWQDAQRALWNAAHEQRLMRLGSPDPHVSSFDQGKELTEARRAFAWLRAVPQDMQSHLLRELYTAWQTFFKGSRGRPRFKSKRRQSWSPMILRARECKRLTRRGVCIPKLGRIRIRGHRPMSGRPVRVSITRDVDQWFISVTCEVVFPDRHHHPRAAIGLDLGANNIVADSEGRLVPNPDFEMVASKQLARLHRQLNRKEKGSRRHKKARMRLARFHRKLRRKRQAFTHQLTAFYSDSHATIAVEQLNATGLTPGAKRRGSGRARLNRSIRGASWYELRRQLSYKTNRTGGSLVVVCPRYTSQQCHLCGHTEKANRRADQFRCCRCGHRDHADVNAARNILRKAFNQCSAGCCTPRLAPQPVKREHAPRAL